MSVEHYREIVGRHVAGHRLIVAVGPASVGTKFAERLLANGAGAIPTPGSWPRPSSDCIEPSVVCQLPGMPSWLQWM